MRTRPGWVLTLVLLAGCLLFSPAIAAAQAAADSAAALTGVREFWAACSHDAGRTWGKSLCGPLITVNGQTGLAIATEQPPRGTFTRSGTLWIGQVPEGMQVANTAFEWNGRLWSTVRLPLPTDRFARIQLLIHESFHRIQPDLGLNAGDAMNAHLDERDGRYLLRLELRAMAAAIQTSGAAARRATTDALLFRPERNRLYPGSDMLENALEIQEGLPEYTGARLALTETGLTAARAAQAAAEFENRPTYVRALGYGTGPLLGILLDRYTPGWRTRIREAGFAHQLASAVGFVPPADLSAAVAASAVRYGGDSLARAEDDRAASRARALAAYRALLVDGPVLVLRADELFRSFDPNNLVPLGASGTVYPNGTFQAVWGVLTVERGGALVAPGNREVRVPVPPATDSTAAALQGDGWRLELRPGWRLRPGPRPGDLTATRLAP
ncbi:MAG: hypothetical protein ABSB58_07720 [Gemmatimonadales bacterium]|jgi:hypothetical protein